jgi:hypothetical protein
MKKHFYILVALAMFPFAAIFAQCAQTANIYSFTYNGHNYEIVKEMKTWINAAACAVERGGYLVEINDQAEQSMVYSKIAAAGISTTYIQVPDGGGTAYIWIGATDKVFEGNWIWDGKNLGTGTNFWNGQGAAGAGGGMAVGGAFINWGGKSTGTPNEPDDYGSLQDAAAIALAGWPSGTTMLGIAGEWNDISISNTLYFIIEKNSSSINENGNSLNFEIFPNPASDFIQFKGINFNQNVDLTIKDISGKTIINQHLSNDKIDISALAVGTYLVNIITENKSYSTQFVKR